jgi:hypothetical protein
MPSEALVCSTLIELADSLFDDFDVIDLLSLLTTRCVDLLDVDTAGVMLVAPEDLKLRWPHFGDLESGPGTSPPVPSRCDYESDRSVL